MVENDICDDVDIACSRHRSAIQKNDRSPAKFLRKRPSPKMPTPPDRDGIIVPSKDDDDGG